MYEFSVLSYSENTTNEEYVLLRRLAPTNNGDMSSCVAVYEYFMSGRVCSTKSTNISIRSIIIRIIYYNNKEWRARIGKRFLWARAFYWLGQVMLQVEGWECQALLFLVRQSWLGWWPSDKLYRYMISDACRDMIKNRLKTELYHVYLHVRLTTEQSSNIW